MPASGSAAARRRRRSRSRRRCAITRSPSPPGPQGRRPPVDRAAQADARRTAALSWEQDEAMHETLLQGRQRRASQGHAGPAEAPLRRRGQSPASRRSATRKRSARPSPSAAGTRSSPAATASSATCVIEVRPLPRGEGFSFDDKITGGVGAQAVDPGGRGGRARRDGEGPARLPGGRRGGDPDRRLATTASTARSSRSAPPGGSAMAEALAAAAPHLLEPVQKVTVVAPEQRHVARSPRRSPAGAARCSAWTPREGWSRWDGSRR